jgi:type IV secretion system protein VirD4
MSVRGLLREDTDATNSQDSRLRQKGWDHLRRGRLMAGKSAPTGLGSDWATFALAGGVAIGALLWGAGWLSAWVDGGQTPHGHPLAGLDALGDPANPSVAWGSPVGPPGLYWTVTAAALAAAAALIVGIWHLTRRSGHGSDEDPTRIEGLASRRQVEKAAGAKALLARSATLRPSLDRPPPGQVGYRIGSSRGVECWASVEDSMFVLGPPRSGKGLNAVIPAILDSPGAVITTATRSDNLAVTMAARASDGPVAVFDPQGLAAGVPSALRWSPIRGCEKPETAMVRAAALCADSGRDVDSASFWKQKTLAALRCLLHAAALGERSPADLYRWSLSPAAAGEAVEILVSSPGAATAWDRALDSIVSADQRMRDSVWAMVANAFAALADPRVLESVSPGPAERFDPAGFLKDRGTLYLLGTASGAASTASLVAALVEDVVEVARKLATASPGGRLDPPLGLILDEAANYPLPSLPALMSEGGGTGITTMAVLQSLDQARHRWGRDAAGSIWDSAIVKIVLPGVSNPDDLAGIARLVGERKEREFSETSGSAGTRSVSSSLRERAILTPATIRSLQSGYALLLLRSAKPIMLGLRPWTGRPDAGALREQRLRVEATIQTAAAGGLWR